MTTKSEEAFKLKANFFSMTVIKFSKCDQRSVIAQLKEIQRTAPSYFHQSPTVIDVTQLKRPVKGLDLSKLCQILRDFQLIPVGVQGLLAEEQSSAQELGLALWQQNSKNPPEKENSSESETVITTETSAESESSMPPAVLTTHNTRVITKPVRSGMQVYAKNSHLVLMAPVSSGAECIADGDIFCYAPVRGRILAGANGDCQAKIFSHHLEAELIAIAGYYLIYDECPEPRTGYFQISLKESKIEIHNFSLERSLLCQK